MIPLLVGAGALGLKALGGVGIGYTSAKLSGNDYDTKNAVIDGGLGAIGIPGLSSGRNAYRGTRLAIGTTNALRGGGLRGSLLGAVDLGRLGLGNLRSNGLRYAVKGGALGTIPFTASDNPFAQATVIADGGNPFGRAAGLAGSEPIYDPRGEGVAVQLPSTTVSPVSINFTPRAAPVFNKTLKDFLADKALQGIVNQQIFATNKPLLDANKSERTKESRLQQQNKEVGAGLLGAADKRIISQKELNKLSADRAAERTKMLEAQTQAAEAQVPITYMQGEASLANAQGDKARANEAAISDALIDRLASAGESYLMDLKEAQRADTNVASREITMAADDAVRANVNQIRQNQAQRGTLLSQLAAEQYKNAVDLHNAAITQFNANEDRRYSKAAAEADIAFKTNVANAEANMAAAEAASEETDPAENPDVKAARKRYDKMNDDISALKSKMVKDPKNPNDKIPYLSTAGGKKELARMRKERDRIRAKYGF